MAGETTPKPILVSSTQIEQVEAEWGQLTWYANARLGNSDYLTLGRCILYEGQSNPRHHHPNCDEVLTVLQGEIRHTWSDGDEVAMREGDTITIPAGMVHQARNVGSGTAVLMIAFTSADRQTIGETR